MTQKFHIFNDKCHSCNIAVFLLHLTLIAPPRCFRPSVLQPQDAGQRGAELFAAPCAAPPAASRASTLSDTYGGHAAELPAEVWTTVA